MRARILVTDVQDRPGLAAIRCLHDGGYRVGAAADTRLAPGFWSRYCSDRVVLEGPARSVDKFCEQLISLLRKNRYDALVPGTDETLFAVSLSRERLEPYTELGLPEHNIVERALDKSCLAREAERVGMPTPEGRICEGRQDALLTAHEFGFPVLVKGVSTISEAGGGLIRYPTRMASDESSLQRILGHFDSCIVQRHETGNLISLAGVVTESGLLGCVVSRYRRMWPPEGGQASFLETIEPEKDLERRVSELVKAIGWRGLFQLQMIERPDALPKPIDFNPRLYGSMSIARAAGVPLTTLWCAWMLGEGPTAVTSRPGIRYRMEDMDARHVLSLARRGRYAQAVAAAMPRRHTTHAYFQLRDPAPLLARSLELARARWSHTTRPGGG